MAFPDIDDGYVRFVAKSAAKLLFNTWRAFVAQLVAQGPARVLRHSVTSHGWVTHGA
jgi:hypothetical protein